MARPTKNNAEYFSHDADMRNDIKVKALRRMFGHKGYAVWCFLLEVLADNDNFEINFNDMTKELLAADFDVTVEELTMIVEYCIKITLFQLRENFLYSEALRHRFDELVANREKKSLAGKLGMQKRWNKSQQSDNSVITVLPDVITENNKGEYSTVKESTVKENIQYPYQDIIARWNSICVSLPRVTKLDKKRRQKIKCRCDEWGKTPEIWLRTAEEIFGSVQASDFLKGSNGSDWKATFDWLFSNGSNCIKVLEGNYDNRRSSRGAQQGDLGIGEFHDKDGRRTYGTGKATIPMNAPPRPSERHAWDSLTQKWIML